MKTKIFGMLLLAGALSLTACDEFLTETPKHSLTTDNSVLNYSGAKNAVNGIYGVYEKYGSNLGGSLYSNLHCMAGFWTYNNEMFNMGYKQSSSSVEGYWTQLYKIINACNAAVNGINKLSDGAFPSLAEKMHCWARHDASVDIATLSFCGSSAAGLTRPTHPTAYSIATRHPN